MGASQSNDETPGKHFGYNVLKVQPGGPGELAGLQPYFDFIVALNNHRLDKDDSTLVEQLQANVGQPIPLIAYNSRSDAIRELTLVPSTVWGGGGLLGVSVRFGSFEKAGENIWHVLEVCPRSPAAVAGLKSGTDYIVGMADGAVHDQADMYAIVEDHDKRKMGLYVFNIEDETCREVSIIPDSDWGGEGSLGCTIGSGLLHRIPTNPLPAKQFSTLHSPALASGSALSNSFLEIAPPQFPSQYTQFPAQPPQYSAQFSAATTEGAIQSPSSLDPQGPPPTTTAHLLQHSSPGQAARHVYHTLDGTAQMQSSLGGQREYESGPRDVREEKPSTGLAPLTDPFGFNNGHVQSSIQSDAVSGLASYSSAYPGQPQPPQLGDVIADQSKADSNLSNHFEQIATLDSQSEPMAAKANVPESVMTDNQIEATTACESQLESKTYDSQSELVTPASLSETTAKIVAQSEPAEEATMKALQSEEPSVIDNATDDGE